MDNIFSLEGIGDFTEEVVEILLRSDRVRIERIISCGQASAEGFWYDQPDDEWVVVLQGDAVLEFEGDVTREMRMGDFMLIPAGKRHRVRHTSSEPPCIWLAVFFQNAVAGA
jgi:cupin 2 domain-containing protein